MNTINSSRAFGCPQRYIQGIGEFSNLFAYASEYGNSFFLIIDSGIENMVKDLLLTITDIEKYNYYFTTSSAESCMEEVHRLSDLFNSTECNVVIGIGGGKVLDTSKLVGDQVNKPRVIVPTIASNDAPAADWAAIYTFDGIHIGGRRTRRSTELVLVDSQIIANAPARLFSAGIGDALATWYESEAVRLSKSVNCVGNGYNSTLASQSVCIVCKDILFKEGIDALESVKKHIVNESVENVIEANVLLSGLGFINGGLAGAHGFHSGFSEIKGCEKYLHGEKVAFGLICQLVLEQQDINLINNVIQFLINVDLPITLNQIGISASDENLFIICDHILNKNALIKNEPIDITFDNLKQAIIKADMLGSEMLSTI